MEDLDFEFLFDIILFIVLLLSFVYGTVKSLAELNYFYVKGIRVVGKVKRIWASKPDYDIETQSQLRDLEVLFVYEIDGKVRHGNLKATLHEKIFERNKYYKEGDEYYLLVSPENSTKFIMNDNVMKSISENTILCFVILALTLGAYVRFGKMFILLLIAEFIAGFVGFYNRDCY